MNLQDDDEDDFKSWIKEQKKGKKEEKQVGIELVYILYKHYEHLSLLLKTVF